MIGDFLTGWRDITPQMRQRVRRVLKDWQQHARPFEDTTYWAKRFLPFADVFAHTLPTRPVQLYRAERTDIDNRYTDRFTSWSRNPDAVSQFGWGKRRMVTAVFAPEDILVDFVNLDLDTEGFQEVIVRPGRYEIIPWRLGWDRTGHFNVYEQPDRARAAGITLGAARTKDKLPVVMISDRDWTWVTLASEGNEYAQARLADLCGWDGDDDQLAKVRVLGTDHAIIDIEIDGSVYASYKVK